MEEYQRYVVCFIKGLIVLSIIFFVYIFLTKLIFYILPFIIGWLLASIINPVVNFVDKKTKISRGFISIFMLLFFFSILSLLVFLGGSRLIKELNNISEQLPQYTTTIEYTIKAIISRGQNIYFNLPPQFTQIIQTNIDTLIENLTSSLSSAISALLSYLTVLPRTIIFLIVTIVAAFLISKDMKIIKNFVAAQIPGKLVSRLKNVETDLLKAAGGFIKAQLKLMVITFAITLTGLYIIGTPFALTMAIIIGLVDALPILGTGAFWATIAEASLS